jgi:tetratricopeptide (TPR) repeat protein
MASSSRVSYPIVWGIVIAMFVALGLGVVVFTRVQTASTPHTPTQLNLSGWQNIVRDNPQNSGAQLQLGYAYYSLAQQTKDASQKRALLLKALAAYDVSLKLNPKTQTTQYNRGLVLQELGRTDEALAVFEAFIKENKGQTVATHDAGMIYLARHDLKKAIPDLESAVSTNPSASDFRIDLAKAYIEAGNKSKATAQLKYALSMEPDNKEAQSMLASLTTTPKKKAGGK